MIGWLRANARNVSFWISLRWPIHIINPVDKTKLFCYTPHRRSTTVYLETCPPPLPSLSETGRTEQISRHYRALRHFSAEEPWVLEWIRIPSKACGRANSIWIRYVWTGKFLNPERKSCSFKKNPDTCGRGLDQLHLVYWLVCLGLSCAFIIKFNWWTSSICLSSLKGMQRRINNANMRWTVKPSLYHWILYADYVVGLTDRPTIVVVSRLTELKNDCACH